MIVIGLMSGTSADGIEAAAADVDPARGTARLLAHRQLAYSDGIRARVLEAGSDHALTPRELALLRVELADANAEAALALARELGVPVDLICMHGQTIAHYPDDHATYQLADGARVAVRTGVPVVCDLRSADVAAGGQGAPLVPFADHVLFRDRAPIALLNLGGIANLTLLPTARAEDAIAFDCGPANMVLDALVADRGERFDRDGRRALRGRVNEKALDEALAHPYFARRPPKSTGREDFGVPFATALLDAVRSGGGSTEDALATAAALTARSVADALRAATPRGTVWSELVIAGGGAANPSLTQALAAAVAPLRVRPMDDHGIAAPAREALAFAILGAYRVAGLPNTLPQCTGASRAVSAGALHQP